MKRDIRKQKKPYQKSPAVKALEKIVFEAAIKKNPDMPVEWITPRKYRDDFSSGLTRCCIDFLIFMGFQAERISNTGRIVNNQTTFTDVLGNKRTIGSSTWIPGSGTNGTADISANVNGVPLKIEIKYGRDRQSEAQKQGQEQVEAAGGIYLIVRSFQEFYEWYNRNLIKS